MTGRPTAGGVANPAPPPKPAPQDNLYTRYLTVKTKHKDAILFYRVGDFAEVFGEDAKTVSKALDLTLVSRDVGGTRIPMCGVPYTSLDVYLITLKQKGYKTAVQG